MDEWVDGWIDGWADEYQRSKISLYKVYISVL